MGIMTLKGFVLRLVNEVGCSNYYDKQKIFNTINMDSVVSEKDKSRVKDWLEGCKDDKFGILVALTSLLSYLDRMGIAKFEKVSFEQFSKDMSDTFGCKDEDFIRKSYDSIVLPSRATVGSAGYDISTTVDFELKPGETIKFPTGLRCRMDEDWVLQVFPRSGLGFKYRCQLDNTVGVIDSDYYGSDNEGHIFVKITNDSRDNKVLSVKLGDAVCQGIFVKYGLTEDDDVSEIRNGGFGSTSK